MAIMRISRRKIPRMCDCCRPAAEMAACSSRASLWDILERLRIMVMSMPNPNKIAKVIIIERGGSWCMGGGRQREGEVGEWVIYEFVK